MKRYFSEVSAPTAADAAATLWNMDAASIRANPQPLIEQYKLYVEMADRVSSRRGVANTFFLTLNTAVFTAIGAFWAHPPTASASFGLFPLISLVLQCLVWYWIIRSYRSSARRSGRSSELSSNVFPRRLGGLRSGAHWAKVAIRRAIGH